MTIIDTKHAPGAIGPYSQAYETNGLVITSGQLPVNPADGAMPEGIASWPTSPTLPPSTRCTPGTLPPSPPAPVWR